MGYNHVSEIFDVDWLFVLGLHLCANLSKTLFHSLADEFRGDAVGAEGRNFFAVYWKS